MIQTADEAHGDVEGAVEAVIETHREGIERLNEKSVQAAIARGVRALDRAGTVFVFGIGPSGALAEYAVALLTRHGRSARVLNATGGILADQLLPLRPGDALLVMAYGRTYAEIVLIFDEAQRLRIPVVLITEALQSSLGQRADVIITARRGRKGRVALHGGIVIVLEALVMGLAVVDPGRAVESLSRLGMLRSAL